MADPRLGIDLAVLRTPAPLAAHEAEALDVLTRPRPARWRQDGAPAAPQGARPEPAMAREVHDLATLEDRENLAQALILRLLTPRGSLAALGHQAYGSRLHELIGRRKTEELRGLCRAYVLEAVAQEPRVDTRAVALDFDPPSELPWEFRFTLVVQPLGDDQTLALDLEVGL